MLIKNVCQVEQTGTGRVMVVKLENITEYQKAILADPQTSGGLLIAVDENSIEEVKQILSEQGIEIIKPIGKIY